MELVVRVLVKVVRFSGFSVFSGVVVSVLFGLVVL